MITLPRTGIAQIGTLSGHFNLFDGLSPNYLMKFYVSIIQVANFTISHAEPVKPSLSIFTPNPQVRHAIAEQGQGGGKWCRVDHFVCNGDIAAD
jgi:hypothetical protein